MAVRRVEIRLTTTGFDAAQRSFERLSLTIDKIMRKVDELSLKMDKLSNKDVTPTIDIKGLAQANAELDKFGLKMDLLGRKDITPGVDPKTGKFSEARFRRVMDETTRKELAALSALASSIGVNKRSETLSRTAEGFMPRELARLNRELAAGGGNEGAGGGRFGAWLGAPLGSGSFLSRLGSPVGVGAIAALLGPAASLIDALTGFGIGTGVAGAGVAGVQHYNPAMLAPGMSNISRSLSTVFQSIGPSVGMMGVGLGKFVQGNVPMLGKLFSASLPFMQAWIKILEVAATTILPAFTKAMNQMVKSGALKLMVQGFALLMKGIANFITALGPGMKAGAETFRALMMGIEGLLTGLGIAFGQLGKVTGIVYHAIHDWWDKLRHNTAVIFDGMRHEIAHVWDIIFNNTVHTVEHIYHDMRNWFDNARHAVANTFDGLRHDIAHWWDVAWQYLSSKTQSGISTVVNFFKALPGKIGTALASFGKMLLTIGTTAMHDFLTGLQTVGGTILSWIKGFFAGIPHAIMSLLHMSPPHPGSVFYDLGANFMHHVQAGIQSRAASVAAAAKGVSGGSAAAYAHALANKIGWGGQWGAINAVEMREAGWNMRARNPSSGAYGIAQFINGPSEYYQYGGNPNTVSGQVIAFFNYIKRRYGNPSAALAHEMRFGWYDKGGKLPPGLSLALNTTGHDEIHTTGSGGGDHFHINVSGDFANPDATALRVIQAIKDYKRHHGHLPTGIG